MKLYMYAYLVTNVSVVSLFISSMFHVVHPYIGHQHNVDVVVSDVDMMLPIREYYRDILPVTTVISLGVMGRDRSIVSLPNNMKTSNALHKMKKTGWHGKYKRSALYIIPEQVNTLFRSIYRLSQ